MLLVVTKSSHKSTKLTQTTLGVFWKNGTSSDPDQCILIWLYSTHSETWAFEPIKQLQYIRHSNLNILRSTKVYFLLAKKPNSASTHSSKHLLMRNTGLSWLWHICIKGNGYTRIIWMICYHSSMGNHSAYETSLVLTWNSFSKELLIQERTDTGSKFFGEHPTWNGKCKGQDDVPRKYPFHLITRAKRPCICTKHSLKNIA